MRNTKLNKFAEMLHNEIYKDEAVITLEDRLIKSYEVIKTDKYKSIYNKMKEKDFLICFIEVTQTLIYSTDKERIKDLIDLSYIILDEKENVKDTYFKIKKEIESIKPVEERKPFKAVKLGG